MFYFKENQQNQDEECLDPEKVNLLLFSYYLGSNANYALILGILHTDISTKWPPRPTRRNKLPPQVVQHCREQAAALGPESRMGPAYPRRSGRHPTASLPISSRHRAPISGTLANRPDWENALAFLLHQYHSRYQEGHLGRRGESQNTRYLPLGNGEKGSILKSRA